MTTDDDFDRQIQAYLESGPAELADRVLWAARAQLKTTRRRRPGFAWLAPWRNPNMTRNSRLMLVGGGALVVAIGAGLVGSILARPNPGPAASAAQSAPGISATPSAPSSSVAPGPSSSVVAARAPGWSATAGMAEARSGHTATLLSDGKVLVAGGTIGPNAGLSANSAELYDPGSGTWSATGSMQGAHDGHTATLLQNGTVLVAGGAAPTSAASHSRAVRPEQRDLDCHRGPCSRPAKVIPPRCSPMARCSLWAANGDPTYRRAVRPGQRDLDGHRETDDQAPRRYIRRRCCPMAGCSWQAARRTAATTVRPRPSCMTRAPGRGPSPGTWCRVRLGHTATLLPDGQGARCRRHRADGDSKAIGLRRGVRPDQRVLDGHREHGRDSGSAAARRRCCPMAWCSWPAASAATATALASAELYDRGTGTWTAAPNMDTPRADQTATLLPDGRVLVAGGASVIDGTATPAMASAELYDPGVGN